jgi:hypothetical protein
MSALVACLAPGAAGDADAPFLALFDGRTLDGWTGEYTDRYTVRDGAIVDNGGNGWLRCNQPFQDFELRAEYRALKREADGGLFFRASRQCTPKDPHWPAKGYQLLVTGARNHFAIVGFGVSPPRFDRKSSALKEAARGPGQWQTITLRVVGTHAEAELNGKTITVSDSI